MSLSFPAGLLAAAVAAGLAGQAGQAGGIAGTATRTQPAVAPPAHVVADTGAREQTADQQVLHALNRLAFGPRPGDVERVRAIGVDAWIAGQLAPARLRDSAGEALASRYAALAL